MQLDDNNCLGVIDKVCNKAGKGNSLESNESSEVEVNRVVIVDEPMKVEDKNKSEVSVDKFVYNDEKSKDIEDIWKWFKREKTMEIKVEMAKQKRRRRKEPDGGTNVSFSMNGNSDCMELDVESVEECLSGVQMDACDRIVRNHMVTDKPLFRKFVKNNVVKNGNEVLDIVGDIKKEKVTKDNKKNKWADWKELVFKGSGNANGYKSTNSTLVRERRGELGLVENEINKFDELQQGVLDINVITFYSTISDEGASNGEEIEILINYSYLLKAALISEGCELMINIAETTQAEGMNADTSCFCYYLLKVSNSFINKFERNIDKSCWKLLVPDMEDGIKFHAYTC
ncbi:hypothetical protein Tco_0281141 [Tanacetum coccineum]